MKGDGLDRWRIIRGTVCVLASLYLIAPLVIVVIISFSAASFLQFPPPGLSLRWYQNLFNDPAWTDSLSVSIKILIPSASIATVLGTAAAFAIARGRIPGASIIGAALMLPIVVPGIITAAALFGLYRGLGLNGTLTGLIIGHVVITMPYVVATVGSALKTMDPRLEDAASTLGARSSSKRPRKSSWISASVSGPSATSRTERDRSTDARHAARTGFTCWNAAHSSPPFSKRRSSLTRPRFDMLATISQ